MSVYRPTYLDQKTGRLKKQAIWWYAFVFAGRRVRESSKSTRKTIAQAAEKNRRLELERGFNNIEDNRRDRIRTIAELADEFLNAYRVRNPKSATFAEYAVGHFKERLGNQIAVDVTDAVVKDYQTARLKDQASPKSINEEVGFLLRILGEQGDYIRAKLRRSRELKLRIFRRVARAFTPAEKTALRAEAKKRRSPSIYPALMLALHAGMRDAEIRGLIWDRVDLQRAVVTVGAAKTEAAEGRTIPLNADVQGALVDHSKWFLRKFQTTNPALYVFPFGRPQPTDATRPATSFKTVWAKIRKKAGVTGRWHDSRHTFITDLAESGQASDETIRDIAGHVSKQMLKHYSHIRMEAKRRALDALVLKPVLNEPVKETAKVSLPN
ncbi:MAG TPA: site-specific integrase [Bryobacteraceae bacterium]